MLQIIAATRVMLACKLHVYIFETFDELTYNYVNTKASISDHNPATHSLMLGMYGTILPKFSINS